MRRARVIVVGGGIVGCSVLYHLARAGCADALLLERAELTSGATWHAAGNVHNQHYYANMSLLQTYSLDLYDKLHAETGREVGARIVGGFFLAQTRERMEEFKFLAGKFKGLGMPYELVTPAEIKAKSPLVRTDGLQGGAWDPHEGFVDSYSVSLALAAAAKKRGADFVCNARVSAIKPLPNGGWCLQTADGEEYECETLVNAAGFWANDVAAMVGARLPVVNMEHQYLVTETMPEISELTEPMPMLRDTDAGFYMRQEGKGLLVGAWEKDCRAAWGGKSAPWEFGMELFDDDLGRMQQHLDAACYRVPAMARAGVKRAVNGAISFSPDGRPLMGPLPGVPGFFAACGFLSGITQGGGAGLAAAQWILEGSPQMDLSFMDVARFGEWTTGEFARARVMEIFPRRYEVLYPQMERESGRGLRKTPIHEELIKRGAVMGQVFGWERPLWYSQNGEGDHPDFSHPNWWAAAGEEARAIHNAAGLLELSSYAKFIVEGRDTEAFLNSVLSNRLPSGGEMRLSLMLGPEGGIIGDVVVARLAADAFYLVGASLAEGIYARWLQQNLGNFSAEVRVVSGDYAALAVMGPASRAVLEAAAADDDFSAEAFPFMRWRNVRVGGAECRALRVCYAGELGWELHCPMPEQAAVFDSLQQSGEGFGMRLAGSRALSHLRLEKGYKVWSADITREITPAAAGMTSFCRADKGEFIGRDAVLRERNNPPERRLATLTHDADPQNPAGCWGSEPVFAPGNGDGKCVGYVTSGGYGWRINSPVAVAWIDSEYCKPGAQLEIQILNKRVTANVAADPLFDSANKRMRG